MKSHGFSALGATRHEVLSIICRYRRLIVEQSMLLRMTSGPQNLAQKRMRDAFFVGLARYVSSIGRAGDPTLILKTVESKLSH